MRRIIPVSHKSSYQIKRSESGTYSIVRYDGKIMYTCPDIGTAELKRTYLDNKDADTERKLLEESIAKKASLGSIKSTGGSSDYYIVMMPTYPDIPKYVGGVKKFAYIEVEDIIEYVVGNDFDLGNIIKASRRIDQFRKGVGKAGTDELYDWKKIQHTATKMINRLEVIDDTDGD